MDRKTSRLCLLITTCSLSGVILGGTASQAEIAQCRTADTPTNSCLTKDPMIRTIEGMSMGLVAGAGAAAGAVVQIKQNDL
jgi:hypothetical protein